jgi:hypothetical protein
MGGSIIQYVSVCVCVCVAMSGHKGVESVIKAIKMRRGEERNHGHG